jgi:hypothetical protein
MRESVAFLLRGLCPLLIFAAAYAKEPPAQVIVWPETGSPVVRISFGKFKEVGSNAGQHNYTSETTAENLWSKPIARADFSLYLFDKNKTRIGEGWISLTNVGVGETIKFQTSVSTQGTPISISLAPRTLPDELQSFLPSRTISVTVNSVPQGAELKVDGVDAGTTPRIIKVNPGKHILEFSKDGFNTGHFPLELSSNDASGGSLSFELGTSAHDTVELRDGSVLTGDLVSITGMEVVIKVGGADQHVDRNQVRRILLVQREAPESSSH